jgi:hypothetical protein
VEERAASRAAPEEEEAVNQEREHGPELRSMFAGVNTYTTGDICTAGNAFAARDTDATPPTGRPRLHRRTTVSTAPTLLSPSPWSPSCVGFATSRRVTVVPYLSAGHRAAGLPYRDGGAPEPIVLLGAAVAVR